MTIADRLQQLRARIADACAAAHRDPADVRLIGVAKGVSATDLASAVAAGLTDIGENYMQEVAAHQTALRPEIAHGVDVHETLAAPSASRPQTTTGPHWHYIGALQSNKTRAIANNFSWVHTLDRGSIAARLAAQRAPHLPPLNVLIQVNFDGEASKAGVSERELSLLAQEILALPTLRWRGLMAIPAPCDAVAAQRASFARVRCALEALRERFPAAQLDSLSMGMSEDFAAAIAEGATHIRIGTALFGARQQRAEQGAEQRADKAGSQSIAHAEPGHSGPGHMEPGHAGPGHTEAGDAAETRAGFSVNAR